MKEKNDVNDIFDKLDIAILSPWVPGPRRNLGDSIWPTLSGVMIRMCAGGRYLMILFVEFIVGDNALKLFGMVRRVY